MSTDGTTTPMSRAPGLATDAATAHRRGGELGKAGAVTVLAGVIGLAAAVAVLLTPPAVPATRFSYPFEARGYVVSELLFGLQHLTMLAGVVGLAVLVPRSSRLGRAGLWLSGIGLVLLTGCEIFSTTAATASVDSAQASLVGAAYGLPTVLTGLGFVLLGVVVVRQRLLPGAGRWLPMVFGGYVFVVLLPALIASDVAARLAIGTWMGLYALIGFALVRARRSQP